MLRGLSICVTAALFSDVPARADLVNVNSIGTINPAAGAQSAAVTLGLQHLNPGTAVTMLGWSLGLRVVPLGGATGNVTLDRPSFTNAVFKADSIRPVRWAWCRLTSGAQSRSVPMAVPGAYGRA